MTNINKNNEIKDLVCSMLDHYRKHDCFTNENINKLLELADYTELEVSKAINKFYYINTKITSNGGVPILKQVLNMLP